MRSTTPLWLLVVLFALVPAAFAQNAPDLTKQPTLYVVGYAHLDTEWRWEYPQTILEFLPSTLHDNFALFEKYPHYVFNFSGANRYRMMKEYYPADYERMRQYVKQGRWFPAGSSMEEGDVNSPSAESIIRQVLYGSRYFRSELGRSSAEFMLPDCFGFPASLPSLLAHAGVKGFSTQKLTWGSRAPVGGPDSPEQTPRGTPFNVGMWEGPDGRTVIAALNPGDYSADITYDLTSSAPPPEAKRFVDWPARVRRNGEVSGLFTDYHYYGTGDVGGSPREPSVSLVESLVTKDAPLRVISATAEQMFVDLERYDLTRLPRYKGELELTEHSAGSLTSQAYQKRWNHRNELLADAAEKASIAAAWLGGRPYPQKRLNDAWTLVMGGQFHDIAAGTATPKSYEYSWNDDVVAMNQFASTIASATEDVAAALDTRVDGTPVIVYNPLDVAREDIVEATLHVPGTVRVFGPDGREVPSQREGNRVLFLARVASVGYAVYDVRQAPTSATGSLKVTSTSLENDRYRIALDENGDVRSIVDKKSGKEILSAPARLAFQTEHPHDWPAWNMDWSDQQKPPRGYVSGPATVRISENGAARVALEVTRHSEGSSFVQTIRLSTGDAGNRVEFDNVIDWKSEAAALKAVFPLTASNPEATYNWEVGTVRRGNNDPNKYEVATHEWIDLTDREGKHGVTLLTGGKYGSDKPDDNTLRLTIIYTPGLGEGNGRAYADQTSQDWGRHEILYGLASHAGDRRAAQTDWQALRLSQPLMAFTATKHAGGLGKELSLLRVDNPGVRVLAMKKAEDSDEIIVRAVELDGRNSGPVRIAFAAPVRSAREVNGQEMAVGDATIAEGALATTFTPYQLHSFAIRLAPPAIKLGPPVSVAVSIPYDSAVATTDGAKSTNGFDSSGRAVDSAMLPAVIDDGGILFRLGPGAGKNALIARGQAIPIPRGAKSIHLLAAAEGDQLATFVVGNRSIETKVQDWTGYIGQWDTRIWKQREEVLPPRPDAPPDAPPRKVTVSFVDSIAPGFIKPAPVAWFASHRHDAAGHNEPYAYSYLFRVSFDVPEGATMLRLPDNGKIRLLAVTASDRVRGAEPAQPLCDTLER